MYNILHLRNDVSRAKKKCAEYIGSSRPKIISAQDITISSTYTIIVLVKIKKLAYKFGPTSNVIYLSLTATLFRAIWAGLHEAEESPRISSCYHAHVTETPNTRLFDMGKTRVYRGSFNHFFPYFCSKT